MANWAVVVGIDKYWTPSACLSGAVRDALRMREWLSDINGGGVNPGNLFLLLSPNKPEEVPAGLNYLPATQEMMIKVIERVVQQSGGEGDRLFFHYSGHGLTAWINFSEQEALVPEDFTDQLTIRSLGLRSILEYFESTQFREQFFFIDACRNIPWEGDFRIGEMSWARRKGQAKPAVQQFVFYATSPGVKAAENGLAGNEQGAFTQTLLAGLTGKGKAKVWDYMSGEYLVRVDRLFDYLVSEMEKKKVSIAGEEETQMFQVPRLGGERGAVSGSNPVLARFPADTISKESLNILVDPFTIEAQVAVAVEREGTTIAKEASIAQVPVTFTLSPREYIVRASAFEFEPKEKRCPVELYDSQQITIKLIPKVPPMVSNDAAVMRGAPRDESSDILPKNWSEDLKPSVRAGKQFLQTYGAFMQEADRAELEELIKQGEQALEEDNQVEGRRTTQALQNKIFGCGTASQLFIAERAMQDAPPREAKQIAEAVKFIRAAHADDDQASMDQFSMALRLTVAHLLARRREDLEDKTRPLRGLRDSFRNEWLFLQDYPAGQARLIVSAGDPIAPLEITSNAGQILKIGYGAIECEHLNPGFYRVRLVLPETAPSEMLVEFSGKTTVVRFQPPESPSTRVMAMLSRLNLNRGAFDHMVTDQVSTLLTLAASTGARSESSDGSLSPRNLREPHFRAALRRMFGYGGSDRAAESSLQVLFGIESDARGRTDEYSLRLWSRDEVIPESLDRPVEFSEIKGLGEFVRVTQPGDYWLAVQLRDQKPILLALKLLPRHLTMLIFHVNTKGEARVFQYLLPRLPDQAFDWEMLRRLELVQRFYLSGRLDHAYEFAKDLAMAGEPLTLCLTGYLLLKLGRLEEANRIAAQVIESSGELSDGHVLNAECEASRGKQGAARVSYLAALERGVPIFQDGLVQLFFGAQNHQIAHPLMPLLASMLKNRVRGVIWSAWSPETLDREVFLQQKFASGAEV